MKRNAVYTLGFITLVAAAAIAAGAPAPREYAAIKDAAVVGGAAPAMSYAYDGEADGLYEEAAATASREDGLYGQSPAPAATEASPYIENLFLIEVAPTAPTPEPTATPQPSLAPVTGFGITVLTPEGGEPKKRVLIYHTHTYEAYRQEPSDLYEETEQWRTADSRYNTLRVGGELAALLTAQGFSVTHDETAFEPPDLAGAYARSLDMLTARLNAGERYDLYIDLHRDAYLPSQTGSNTVSVGGADVARLMLLIGKGEGQTSEGFQEKPDWQTNLAAAQAITDALNAQHEGLCKSVRLKAGRFNQHVDTGCVLVEAGNNYNTLSEALAAMPYLADAIAEMLEGE